LVSFMKRKTSGRFITLFFRGWVDFHTPNLKDQGSHFVSPAWYEWPYQGITLHPAYSISSSSVVIVKEFPCAVRRHSSNVCVLLCRGERQHWGKWHSIVVTSWV
jgi:hypothetical protein